MSQKQSDNLRKDFSAIQKRIIILAVLLGGIVVFANLYPFEGARKWIGIGKNSNKSIEKEIDPQTKKVTKTTKEIENIQSSKTLWDLLQLGSTFAVPLAVFLFNRAQDKRANDNLREQALETYLDTMYKLLIDNKLKVLIQKQEFSKPLESSNSEEQKLNAVINIACARTSWLLQRLDQDKKRQQSVIEFLRDVKLLDYLSDANFSHVNFSNLNLESANFSKAKLVKADLSSVILSNANFSNANLRDADLSNANLRGADLRGADLRGATVANASFGSNIGLTEDMKRDLERRGAIFGDRPPVLNPK